MSEYKITDSQNIYFVTFATVEWVDVFSRKEYADIVIDSLKFCQEKRGLEIYAWCLMSNHIHLIISTKGESLPDILRDLKKFTATRIIAAIEKNAGESRRKWMLWIFKSAGQRNANNKNYQLWQQDYHAKTLETNAFKNQKLRYVHNNPVVAGLVDEPEDYRYSSAKNYAGKLGLIDVMFL